LNLSNQKVFKNAPFDVTESKLQNTFFTTWDSIKNNVLLNWVDITDGEGKYGLALFTDHTTAYAHGKEDPLGLITQYSGVGLWGRNYSITGPTEFSYAILPHEKNWANGNVWTKNISWNNPMPAGIFTSPGLKLYERSLIHCSGKGLEISSAVMDGNDLLVRFFNSNPTAVTQTISFDGTAKSINLEELSGKMRGQLIPGKDKIHGTQVDLYMEKFGIRTIRLVDFKTTIQPQQAK